MAKNRKDRKRAAKAVAQGKAPPAPTGTSVKLPPRKKGRKNIRQSRKLTGAARKRAKAVKAEKEEGEPRGRGKRRKRQEEEDEDEEEEAVAQAEESEGEEEKVKNVGGQAPEWKFDGAAKELWLRASVKNAVPNQIRVKWNDQGAVTIHHPQWDKRCPFPDGYETVLSKARGEWEEGKLTLRVPATPSRKRKREGGVKVKSVPAVPPRSTSAPAAKRKGKKLVSDTDQAELAASAAAAAASSGSQQFDVVAEKDLWHDRQDKKVLERRKAKLEKHYAEKHERRRKSATA
eukprot:Hpha_TRINITY_DN16018_c2_g4::TRINITY_DN16018_c2_g4_i1::g.118164::m.118164